MIEIKLIFICCAVLIALAFVLGRYTGYKDGIEDITEALRMCRKDEEDD